MALEGQTKWYLSQIDLSVECPSCQAPTTVSLDEEINSFVGTCEECEYLCTAVVVS